MTTQKYFVYFLTNFLRTTLYIGVTRDLIQRVDQHHASTVAGFTKKYHLDLLIYYEEFDDSMSAIQREKQLKGWRRSKKEALIARSNPSWKNLGIGLGLSG